LGLSKKVLIFIIACFVSCTPKRDDKWLPSIATTQAPEVKTLSDHESSAKAVRAKIFYLLHKQKTKEAIDELLAAKERDPYIFHTNVVGELGLSILLGQEGGLLYKLYGCAIACDERTLPLIRQGLASDDPMIQLAALAACARINSDETERCILEAMKSDYLVTRLEGAYLLAIKHSPLAFFQIEALRQKVPQEAQPFFPELFAVDGSEDSQAELKRLLFDKDVDVRAQAVVAVASAKYDHLLLQIRKLLVCPDSRQQEACAYAIGQFLDRESQDELLQIADHASQNPALAADYALFLIGCDFAKERIEKKALAGDLFAISLLGKLPSKAFLHQFLKSPDFQVRVNAAIASLDKEGSEVLEEILLCPKQGVAIQMIHSHVGTLTAYKVVSQAVLERENNYRAAETSLRIRESLLTRAAKLPEEAFLHLIRALFEQEQRDLIPCAVHLLEQSPSQRAIELLKEQEERIGSPFIRAWCQIALFRLQEEGPYQERVCSIIKNFKETSLLQARPLIPWVETWVESREPISITYEESSQLLIEAFIALAERQEEQAVRLLLQSCRDAHPETRFLLAGLLMRSAV
jgi:HEAT repeat protein